MSRLETLALVSDYWLFTGYINFAEKENLFYSWRIIIIIDTFKESISEALKGRGTIYGRKRK